MSFHVFNVPMYRNKSSSKFRWKIGHGSDELVVMIDIYGKLRNNTMWIVKFPKEMSAKYPTNTEFIYRDLQRTGYSPIVEEKLQELRNQIQIVSERDGVPANRWDLTAYYGKPGFEFEE
ncbi:hypothetical protein DERF_010115 [Dermatophagoides farinae]|uniref:Uncharacterized protein n=1 Tax=Dermatophagoides farinae TaxID=6954 RepID=A0A922HVD7_DERFA|nr:hypothetical protein HUG17_0143 [Dermatophagoides farinae]KAH9511667.1 hypothetical protein DERF_010115 [Dermatophagoides farinae]